MRRVLRVVVVKKLYVRIMLLVMLIMVGLSAQAHKVNMFAFAEGKEVFVEGYFTDGKKPKKCEVIVYDAADKQLLTGLSNDDGQFSFVIPAPGGLRITFNAGEGHQAEYFLSAEELAGGENEQNISDSLTTTAVGTMPNKTESPSSQGNTSRQAMIQIMRSLDELKERRSLSDIIGGIGIIMGIGGLFLYFQARKMTKKPG